MSARHKRFDWHAIHAELDDRMSALGSTIEDDCERVQDLLRARSAALAAVAPDTRARARVGLTRLLVFRLGEERYALALEHAREVVELRRCATLPGARPGLVGIISWRGEFVAVFDLARLLGLGGAGEADKKRVIVLRGEDPPIAIRVDAVEEVIQSDLTALQGREQLRSKHAELLRGATADAVLVLANDALRARLAEELRAA